jgi:type IV pilus assembly protein PilE
MKREDGFTLIELMIVVAIVGVIALFAFPQYERYGDRARRTDAQSALLSLAQHMERRFTENNWYCDSGSTTPATCGANATGDLGAPAFFGDSVPLDGGDAYYNLRITAVTETTFEIQAQRTGSMANDECGDFVLTQTGVKTQNNNTEDCW